MARILVIEPDPERAATLQQLVSTHLGAEIVLTASASDALVTLAEVPADLILTSSLLAPGEDEQLAAHLRAAPDLDYLPVLTIPPLVEIAPPPSKREGLWSRVLRRRQPQETPRPAYDFGAIAARIEQALAQSKSDVREAEIERPARLVLLEAHETMSLIRAGSDRPSPRDVTQWRARARRWNGHDLPWLSDIQLTWGSRTRPTLRLLNISSTGVLVESDVHIALGGKAGFQLAGADEETLIVHARVVRVTFSNEGPAAVTYVVAASFDRPFDPLGPVRSVRELRPSQEIV